MFLVHIGKEAFFLLLKTTQFGTITDYLTVIASVGLPVDILPDGSSTTCLEFGFGADGRVDTLDVSAWAWMLSLEESERPLNLCDVPLIPSMPPASDSVGSLEGSDISCLFSLEPSGNHLDALLVTGKRGTNDISAKLEDNLYVLDAQGQYIHKFEPKPNHSNGKLVQDCNDKIYQVNHKEGLLRISDGNCVIPPAGFTIDIEPRYNSNAEVSIGLGREQTYSDLDEKFIWAWVGRPILDVAFDEDGYVYVVPVVIDPDGEGEPYEAAAKLMLTDTGFPPYEIVQLYDDPIAGNPRDNRRLNSLREVEIDNNGNLYLTNGNSLNESDILWVYDKNTGAMKRSLILTNDVNAPLAMHVSDTTGRLYVSSSMNVPEADSVSLYIFSIDDLQFVQTIEINGMGHITDITEDRITGTIWIVGFTMSEIPNYLESNAEPFYKPYIAKIPYDSSEVVEAMCLSNPILYPDNDLALPLSVIWTGTEEKTINFTHTAANRYRLMSTSPDFWSDADFNGESHVTFNNMLVFCDRWLRKNP